MKVLGRLSSSDPAQPGDKVRRLWGSSWAIASGSSSSVECVGLVVSSFALVISLAKFRFSVLAEMGLLLKRIV